MFSRSVQVNKLLYERNNPVILTTARTNDDTFQVSFINWSGHRQVAVVTMETISYISLICVFILTILIDRYIGVLL